MSVDLMDLVRKSVPRGAREGLGEAFGMSVGHSFSLFESAAGLIVGGLKAKSKTPDGAAEIYKTARDQDFGMLDRFGSIVTDEAKTAGLQNAGAKILDGLFGEKLSQVIGDFATANELDNTGASALLKTAAPMVLGILGKIVGKQSLNVAGMASVLSVQPEFVSTPIPTPEVTHDSGNAGQSTAKSSESPIEKSPTVLNESASYGGSTVKYVLAFCAGAILVAGVMWYLKPGASSTEGNGTNSVAGAPEESAESSDSNRALSEAPNTVSESEGFDVEKVLSGFRSLTAGFRDLDEESAPAIAEKLTSLANSIDGLGLDRLKGLSRNLFSIAAKKFRSDLDALLEKHRDEQVVAIIRPAIQKLENKLAEHGF